MKITDKSYLIANKPNFNLDISNWDVFNVKDMSGMFFSASSVFNKNYRFSTYKSI